MTNMLFTAPVTGGKAEAGAATAMKENEMYIRVYIPYIIFPTNYCWYMDFLFAS